MPVHTPSEQAKNRKAKATPRKLQSLSSAKRKKRRQKSKGAGGFK